MKNNGQLIYYLKRFALFGGIVLAIFSIYFSWDGLDNFPGNTAPQFTEAASYIGAVFAVIITLLQFIFNTDFKNLNLTLKILGVASYIYSIYTNYLGIQHLFGFSDVPSAAGALIMDVLPEAFIAWSLGEHLQGDFLGNVVKVIMGNPNGAGQSNQPNNKPQEQPKHVPNHPMRVPPFMNTSSNQPKHGKGRAFLENQYRPTPKKEEHPNRFFGE